MSSRMSVVTYRWIAFEMSARCESGEHEAHTPRRVRILDVSSSSLWSFWLSMVSASREEAIGGRCGRLAAAGCESSLAWCLVSATTTDSGNDYGDGERRSSISHTQPAKTRADGTASSRASRDSPISATLALLFPTNTICPEAEGMSNTNRLRSAQGRMHLNNSIERLGIEPDDGMSTRRGGGLDWIRAHAQHGPLFTRCSPNPPFLDINPSPIPSRLATTERSRKAAFVSTRTVHAIFASDSSRLV